MSAAIRVLLADPSEVVRRALATVLSAEPRIELVGEAADGAEALRMAAALRPDVVAMDVELPQIDGLAATERLMGESPTRVLLLCAVAEEHQLDLSFRAIAAGALELLARPPAPARESAQEREERLRRFGRELLRAILLMAEVPVIRRRPPILSSPGERRPASKLHVEVLGIAASTGGPPALAALLSELPRGLPVSILVAQHIALGFSEGLLRWLRRSCALEVQRAVAGARCQPGTLYLAPDGCDLCLAPGLVLRTPASRGVHSPSADALFSSLADALGPRAAGFVLSGMGDDGAQGLLRLRRAGASCFAQDEQSSAVFGMPRAAFEAGAAQELLSLKRMARLIAELS